MPVDPSKKTPLEIQELPQGSVTTDLVNDRIRALNEALKQYVQNPAAGPADLGQFKIINLADPKNDLDAVNLRTLKRAVGQPVSQDVTGTGSGIENPTIYFAFDGLPFDGEESPYAIIGANRDGFTPIAAFVSAVDAPTSKPCEVNMTIKGVNMLSANLVIPVGSQGPIFTSSFALPGSLRKGTLIQGLIAVAGGATQITIGLALRGNS